MPATLANTEFERREYDLESKTYRARFDPDATTPTIVVVAALAELTGTPPTELEPLQASVDTDSLDRLAGSRDGGVRSVMFPVEAHSVTVYSDGLILVENADSGRTQGPRSRHR